MRELSVVLGAGPVGRAIARQLVEAGRPVRLVSRSGAAPGLPGVEARSADITRIDEANAACAGAAVVHFCAAPRYHRWIAEFTALQDRAIEAAARAGAVLVAIENLYGYGVAGRLHEALPQAPVTRKGRTRAQMTARLFAAHARGDIRAVSGRASDFFGPEVRVSAFGAPLWQALIARRKLAWFGDPDAPHSATYVPDLARALIRLGDTPQAWGRAWHAPAPPPLSPRAFAARAATAAGLPPPAMSRLPALVLRAVGLVQKDAGELVEMRYTFDAPFVLDHSAWDAAFEAPATDLDTALARTADWWRRQA